MNTFGKRVKRLRIKKGLTQEALAKKFLLNKSSVSRYERGQQLPEIDVLTKLADFFDVSTDYLLGRTDDPNAALITGSDVPKELRDLGIKEVGVLKEFKESGLEEDEIIKIIRFYRDMKKDGTI